VSSFQKHRTKVLGINYSNKLHRFPIMHGSSLLKSMEEEEEAGLEFESCSRHLKK